MKLNFYVKDSLGNVSHLMDSEGELPSAGTALWLRDEDVLPQPSIKFEVIDSSLVLTREFRSGKSFNFSAATATEREKEIDLLARQEGYIYAGLKKIDDEYRVELTRLEGEVILRRVV